EKIVGDEACASGGEANADEEEGTCEDLVGFDFRLEETVVRLVSGCCGFLVVLNGRADARVHNCGTYKANHAEGGACDSDPAKCGEERFFQRGRGLRHGLHGIRKSQRLLSSHECGDASSVLCGVWFVEPGFGESCNREG